MVIVCINQKEKNAIQFSVPNIWIETEKKPLLPLDGQLLIKLS